MKKYIFLSYMLSEKTPLYGNIPKISVIPERKIISGDACNTSFVKIHNHSGTHIDAPKHFWDEGKSIADYTIDELTFNSPLVIDCPKSPKEMINVEDVKKYENEMKKCDILLFRTGFWKNRWGKIYRLENPGISSDLARYIRSNFENVRCIGLDSISVSSYSNRKEGRETHSIFLKKNKYIGDPVLLLEDLDLSKKDLDKLNAILVCPLMIKGIDSAPCTVIGIFD